MAKQLNVNLAFKADTSQAKSAIMDLQSSLSKIATMNTNAPGVDPSKLKAASSAAKELSIHLNNAFNAQTGNFDLSKLDRSLKTSQTNVTQLASKLLNAGAAGEQAFVKLAQTISMADRPVVTLNSKLSGILTTLKNTARWQLSSSILHGFMGAVQQAYGYAQDLNKSLNDIRIVSGQSTEQMAQFADEANKAAKNLSTTTTAYTKAALIFYQQGDKGSTITEKSDVVTKMSNVTGQSTSVVSDQLTAIWNNFNKSGDEAYEHYADVLTALGAATASSTDEIAGGLEKFAGIAETVGLSYEYAAAALATITATSRESEDVVGTALKTIFSRIQGLSLGETLDDGTDLNKYSAALEKVGISIKDQTGEIRKMDDILDDMGAKWKTLSNDQQMALAQTVAGVRQYNQLMTLMNNWDFMQENVNTATNSDGALQKQQEIYEESWAAANKRVRASMEAIYTDLIDDEFFIDITNGFSGLIDSVDAFIDGIGGVKTILIGIGSIFLSSVANKIQPALENLKHSFSVVFQTAEQQAKGLAAEMNESITKTLSSDTGKMFSFSSKVALENARDLNIARSQLQAIEPKLNDLEKQRYTQELAMIEAQQRETQVVADRITVLQREKEAILDKVETESLTKSGQASYSEGSREMRGYVSRAKSDFDAADESELAGATRVYLEAKQAADQYNTVQKDVIGTISQIDQAFREMGSSLDLSKPGQNLDLLNNKIRELYSSNLLTIKNNFEELATSADGISPAGLESVRQQIDLTVASMPEVIRNSQEMRDALELAMTAKTPEEMSRALESVIDVTKKAKIETKDFGNVLKEINPERYKALKENAEAAKKATEQLGEMQKRVNKSINDFKPKHNSSTIEQYTQLASTLGKVAMAATSVRSLFQAWGNDDLSFGEKITTSFMSISMLVPSIISAFSGLKNVLLSTAGVEKFLAEAQALSLSTMVAETAAITAKETKYKKASLAVIAHKMATENLSGAELIEFIQAKLNCDAKTAQTIAEKLNKNMKEQNTAVILTQTIATKLQNFADQAHTKTIWTKIAAWIAAKLAAGELLIVTLALTAAIAGIALAGVGLVKFFDWLIVTQEEANEAIDTATENYTKEIDKLKELKGELSSINDSIDELNSKDSLSIVEQSELADLERRKALLEAQVALQEKLAKDAQKKQAEEISKNWDYAKSSGDTEELRTFTTEDGNYVEQTVEEYAKDMGYNIATGEFSKDSVIAPESQENMELYIKSWMEANEMYRKQWQEKNAEQYGKDEENYSAMIAADQSGAYNLSDEEKAKMQRDLEMSRQAMYGEDYDDTFIKPLLGYLESMQVTKKNGNYEVNANVSQETLDVRGLSQDQLNQYLSDAINANKGSMDKLNSIEGFDFDKLSGDQLFTLIDNLDQISNFDGSSMEDLIAYINGIEEIEPPQFNLSEWKSNYSKISEIVKDLETGDSISAEEYAALGDEYKSYFTLQADGTATLIGKASELKDLIHSIEMGELEDNVKKTQDVNNFMTTENARSALETHNAGASYRDLDLDAYMEMVNSTYEQSFTNYEEAISFMEQQNILLGEEQNLRALNAQSTEELNNLLAEGLITTEQFNNASKTVFANEVKSEGFELDAINDYAESLEHIYGLEEDVAQEASLYLSKMNRGVETLNKNWSSWSKNLVASKRGTTEYAEAFAGIKEAVSDLLDIDTDQLDASFFESAENLKLIGKAAEGDADAIDTLRAKAAAEIFLGVGYDLDGLSESEQAVLDSMMNLANEDVVIGAKLNDTQFGQSLIDAAIAAEGTVESIQAMFESLGWEPEIRTKKIPVEQAFQEMSGKGYVDVVDPATGDITRVTTEAQMKSYSSDGMVEIFSINGDATVYKGGGSNTSKPSSSGGGGGGSSNKKAEKKTKSDVVDRYKEVNDQLEETASLMNKNSKIADSLWGPAKFEAMKKGVALMKQENELLKDKLQLAKDYLEEDTDVLFQAAADAGASLEIDADTGLITNYTEEMETLVDRYNQMVEDANADGTVTDAEQDELDDMDDRIEALKDAISQYDETIGEMRDLEESILENDLAIMSENFSILQEQLELEITINDSQMKNVDYFLSKIEDDLYSTAEAYALMSQQAKIYGDNLQDQQNFMDEVTRQYEAGEISQADYKQALLDTQDATIENLEALEATKEAMQDFYSNALNTAVEKVYEYTDSMEQLNSVLDHYSSILSLVGKQEDYATKNKILDGKATNLKNQIDVQSEMYKNASADADKWYQKMSEAVEGSNEYETYRKNWLAAKEIADTAQEEMLAKTEEWAQAMKEIIQNELAEAAKSMEESLTGGTSFDELLTSMERSKSLQEEYLTTTNQIYETNKLINKAQQDIDKSTNTLAKNKLKNFIKETDNLQKQTKLSKFELEIQQAKYDLLLAEIALAESQNAKSNVTLQRDSEGNYGYVYTANQEDIAAAQQQVEDAQNALYNIGLEGANNYAEKYVQLMAQCQDEITELTEMWMNGEIASEEEYNRRRAEIESYYYEQLKTYSNLYQVALGVDTDIIRDAWTSSYGEMTTKTEDWKDTVSNYFDTSAESFKAWEGVCSTALELSGLEDIGTAVDNVKGKSEDLRQALIGNNGVVGALWDEAEAAGEVSEAYLSIQNNIDGVIGKYREYLGLLQESYESPTSPPIDDDPTDNRNDDANGDDYSRNPYTPSTGGNGGNGDQNPSGPKVVKKTIPVSLNPYTDGSGGTITVVQGSGNYSYYPDYSVTVGTLRHRLKYGNKQYYISQSTYSSLQAAGFDTGGYTGSWGPDGKMAMLHEKELVLNAKDTENFLSSIELLDKIIQTIDLYSLNQQFNGKLNSPYLGHVGNESVLEQRVHIEASFPNVTDHNEIEEAFNNLINASSQYINRK